MRNTKNHFVFTNRFNTMKAIALIYTPPFGKGV
jgi:hypothetical protein